MHSCPDVQWGAPQERSSEIRESIVFIANSKQAWSLITGRAHHSRGPSGAFITFQKCQLHQKFWEVAQWHFHTVKEWAGLSNLSLCSRTCREHKMPMADRIQHQQAGRYFPCGSHFAEKTEVLRVGMTCSRLYLWYFQDRNPFLQNRNLTLVPWHHHCLSLLLLLHSL